MKKSILMTIFLTGIWVASTSVVYAETLEGIIASIDAKNNLLRVISSGTSGLETNVSISVSEFIRSYGLAKLNSLDVGEKISMTIGKGASGQWIMRSIKKPNILVPTPDNGGNFLKTAGKTKETNHPRDVSNKLKFVMK